MMWYRNPGKWLRELFPNQTKNIPSIILWSLIYILDIAVVFWLSSLLGITLIGMPYKRLSLFVIIYVLLAFTLFYAEAKLWDGICSKIKE